MSANECELLCRPCSRERQARAKITVTASRQQVASSSSPFTWLPSADEADETQQQQQQQPQLPAEGAGRRRSSAARALYLTKYYFYQQHDYHTQVNQDEDKDDYCAAERQRDKINEANYEARKGAADYHYNQQHYLSFGKTTATARQQQQVDSSASERRQRQSCVSLRQHDDNAAEGEKYITPLSSSSTTPKTFRRSSAASPFSASSAASSTASPSSARSAELNSEAARQQQQQQADGSAALSQSASAPYLRAATLSREKQSSCSKHLKAQSSDSALSLNSTASTHLEKQIKGEREPRAAAVAASSVQVNQSTCQERKPEREQLINASSLKDQQTHSSGSSRLQEDSTCENLYANWPNQRARQSLFNQSEVRRNSSPVEEQLRRLLELGKPQTSERPEGNQQPSVRVQHRTSLGRLSSTRVSEAGAMKKAGSEFHSQGKEGNFSKREANGRSSSSQLSPDDRLMIFMLASRSSSLNGPVERNARILKWLNNCKSAH